MTTTINGMSVALSESALELRLLDFLRETLDLTGTKSGCGIGVCGSCTILLDGRAVQACRLMVREVIGRNVLTIEGLTGPDGALHPLQQAFLDHGAVQCGYCTPGMVLAAHALLLKNAQPTRVDIRRAIKPNLCRCTGYQQIIDAIEAAAVFYAAARLPHTENKTSIAHD